MREYLDVTWPVNQKIAELDLLQNFLKDKRIETVLEIGTFFGGTALLWAKMVEPEDGRVYCIDHEFNWHVPPGFRNRFDFVGSASRHSKDKELKTFDLVKYNQVYKGTQWERCIVEIEGDSHKPEIKKEINNVLVGRVDLLFIDGDHSFEGAKDDFYAYGPLVKQDGVVVLHDILDTPYHRECKCFVHDLWAELKKKYFTIEFVDRSAFDDMGIGVIRGSEICQE
jgi:predicted O-methyltransferase YrrM